MKRAGAKNDGAWFRANRAIHNMPADYKTILATLIAASPFIDSAHNAMLSLATQTGVVSGDLPANPPAWAAQMMANGIPRQVWNGKLTFTTYTEVNGKYVANYQSEFHYFAKDLRRIVRNFQFAEREISDLVSAGTGGTVAQGNPGGDPNSLAGS